ncbi:MAG: YlxR family protein [Actinobacteria bacterium]|nr:YlxR family protein [Actinomycetota bacterium]MCL5887567.1 YlxR family protein [Actinomycetota bacterium]
MSTQAKSPIRTCVGCRKSQEKGTLIRIVRSPDSGISVDSSGRLPGRGAYIHANEECFDLAVKRKRFEPALRVKLYEDDTSRLRTELRSCIDDVRFHARKDGESC